MRDPELKEKWENLVSFISKEFGDGEILDLQAILFLNWDSRTRSGLQIVF